jgi:hypothetical protein
VAASACRPSHLANTLIVVELKRGRPSDKVVGQAARYIGYMRTYPAKPGQPVEGLIIIAHEADEPLRYAVAAFLGLQFPRPPAHDLRGHPPTERSRGARNSMSAMPAQRSRQVPPASRPDSKVICGKTR